jgi:hypothetical protein
MAETAPQDARVVFSQTLKQFGFTQTQIDALIPQITEWQAIYTPGQIVNDLLPNTTVYQERFVANQTRVKNGLKPLSPSEYLAAEEAYRSVMRDAGLPKGFYDSPDDFNSFIANDMSPYETKLRVNAAAQAVNNATPEYKQALRDLYGIDETMMVAYVLDPERALPLVEKQAKAVEFGTAAIQQGLRATTIGEQFATSGPATGYTPTQGYTAIAEMLPTAQKLGQIYGESYDQATAEQEVFGGLASARRKRQKLGQLEQSTFSGQSGLSAGSLKKTSQGQI